MLHKKILSLEYSSVPPNSTIGSGSRKNFRAVGLFFFQILEYKYSQYVMLLAKLLLCMQKQNFWLLHFVVIYKPHVQQECYEYH